MEAQKLKIFVGSSTQQKPKALKICSIIHENGGKALFWGGIETFTAGSSTLDDLMNLTKTVDASIMVFGEDDEVWYRGEIKNSQVRDNVIFEHGLFMGALGKENAIVIRIGTSKMASDLAGITYIPFDDEARAELALINWMNKAVELKKKR
jgi:predicted nucleotide-binding protein